MTQEQEVYTWEQVSKAESGTIFLDKFDEGIRFIIMKGGSSLCAYAGIPIDHPLSGFNSDDLPIEAHGGLTFCGGSDASDKFPKGFYWYGWDYAHSGDYCDYYDKPPLIGRDRSDETKWLPKMVEKDSWSTLYELKKLVKLSEMIVAKKYKIVPNDKP